MNERLMWRTWKQTENVSMFHEWNSLLKLISEWIVQVTKRLCVLINKYNLSVSLLLEIPIHWLHINYIARNDVIRCRSVLRSLNPRKSFSQNNEWVFMMKSLWLQVSRSLSVSGEVARNFSAWKGLRVQNIFRRSRHESVVLLTMLCIYFCCSQVEKKTFLITIINKCAEENLTPGRSAILPRASSKCRDKRDNDLTATLQRNFPRFSH